MRRRKFKRESLAAWLRGYAWSPMYRQRCCGHTAPYHTQSCDLWLTRTHPRNIFGRPEGNETP